MHRRPIVLIFTLSGAAGLVYEVVWARQLVLVFGNTTQAVSTILTAFFAGMAIGALLGGRAADRVRDRLRLYAVVEILLGVVALVTPAAFEELQGVYAGAYDALQPYPYVVALLRFVLCLAALSPATILMGATLPILARHLANSEVLTDAFSRLYAANTIGAVLGTIVAGFIMIELVGLTNTTRVGALCSATAGAIAFGLSRGGGLAAPRSAPAHRSFSSARLPLFVAFVSGLTSLSYQTLWTRTLADGSGGFTYIFTLILAIFLLGIAGGASLYRSVSSRANAPSPLALAISSQVLTVGGTVAGLMFVLDRPPSATSIQVTVAWLIASSILVVLPTTIAMGLSLPAAVGLVDDRTERVGTNAGSLLATNTVGAILATFAVPFVIIPAIGSAWALVLTVTCNAAAAVALSAVWMRTRPVPVWRALSVASVGLLLIGGIVASGSVVDPSVARIEAAGGHVHVSGEDAIAAVAAGLQGKYPMLWVAGNGMTTLTVDTRIMPILPLVLRPSSKTALIIAFGMGSAYREALRAGLTTDAVELVPTVPAMFGQFYPDAAAVLSDPRGRVVIDDGRAYVDLTRRTYDIIIVDPPPPVQAAGVSVISCLEFYEAASKRLNTGGVMLQWVPLGQSLDDLKAHIRTFARAFPHVAVVRGPGGNGFAMLGSDAPLAFDRSSILSVLRKPGIVADLDGAVDSQPWSLDQWAKHMIDLVELTGSDVRAFAGDGPLITDDRPLPEYFLIRWASGTQTPLGSGRLLASTSPSAAAP